MRNTKNIFPDIKTVCSETFNLFWLHSRAVSEAHDQAKVSAGTDLSIQVNFITIRQFWITRKEYLRRFAKNKQKNPYNDKMLRSNYSENQNRNYSK